jgi:hypothetical protein
MSISYLFGQNKEKHEWKNIVVAHTWNGHKQLTYGKTHMFLHKIKRNSYLTNLQYKTHADE